MPLKQKFFASSYIITFRDMPHRIFSFSFGFSIAIILMASIFWLVSYLANKLGATLYILPCATCNCTVLWLTCARHGAAECFALKPHDSLWSRYFLNTTLRTTTFQMKDNDPGRIDVNFRIAGGWNIRSLTRVFHYAMLG